MKSRISVHLQTGIRVHSDRNTQAAQFDGNKLYMLAESQPLLDLITNGTMTVDEAVQLDEHQLFALIHYQPLRQALNDPEIHERLRNGDLTIQDIIGDYVINAAMAPLTINDAVIAPVNINEGQSTHTASVHEAVSESASKLRNTYNAIDLKDAMSDIRTYVSALPDNCQKNSAAKRCFTRISANDYSFTDPASQVTTRQLLALTFTAIHDKNKRIGRLDDALAQFVEGLYEIQRGYNLSSTGVDEGGKDKEICRPGTFNKLIEKLQGIHPDCEIRFITKATATLKLPIVVHEEAILYLSQLTSPQDANDYLIFSRLIKSINDDGVEIIWDKIKQQVTYRMFEEFGSLYDNKKQDADFSKFINAGIYTEIKDLNRFQKEVQESPGYHKYCSNRPNQPGLFPQSNKDTTNSSPDKHNELDESPTPGKKR